MIPSYGSGGTMFMQPQYPQPGSIGGGVLGMPPGAGVPFDLGSGPISHESLPRGMAGTPARMHDAASPYFMSPQSSFTARMSRQQPPSHQPIPMGNFGYSNVGSVERNTPEGSTTNPASPVIQPRVPPASGSMQRPPLGRHSQSESRERANGSAGPSRANGGAGPNGANGNGATQNGGQAAPAAKKKNYYEVLGVPKDATDDQIKKAYRKLAVKMHPDKNPDDPEAEAKFALLTEANTCLMDPVKRIDHNKELAGGDAGWGWNQEAAKKRAQDYQWNGDDLLFNLGAQMQAARQRKKTGPLTRCFEGIFGHR